ncbi:hypothetical protein YPPY66_0627 [Yersinia pestis PY-66]|uniref:Uncharacterized protein n=2 Tax=Yersinia pseudotuberculosis complex TaxID=1649845 RepID=A0A0U1QUC1_YERP3|nr:hypothetical protein YpsIP31758_3641 [Yersinia pseudotuberculosis IP 31758]ABX85525.1 hypothetical protein YpAngola_A0685 [Yersinia pestis Angola]ADV97319.1 hypothetical protein YPC_0613 [Yersinia pestis biovar Medievalis str. Harbin 35]EDR34140.1 hypothetical protein YPIP275_3332 [Yersinia pestis biovar Orientalis str. IP275]EDR41516.1 hypothetical protein YpE1979001_1941 [Yersinia pestis biovar Antiqua str. E1979001]EEO75798.1 hypothetical protein YP516_3734 [Yersinia pestis Nepal516]EEO
MAGGGTGVMLKALQPDSPRVSSKKAIVRFIFIIHCLFAAIQA